MNKITFFLIICVSSHQSLLPMEDKKDATPTKAPSSSAPLEIMTSPESTKRSSLLEVSHHHDSSKRASFIINFNPLDEHVQSESAQKARHSTKGSISELTSITVEPAAPQALSQPEKPPRAGKALTFSVDMQDIRKAKIDDIGRIIDEIIRQTSIAVFATHDENAFYIPELRSALLQAFGEYLANEKTGDESETGSSSSSTHSDPHPISSGLHVHNSFDHQVEALTRIRHGILKRVNSRDLPILRDTQEAAKPTQTDVQAHNDLKEWFRLELELHELKMKEQQRQLQEQAAKDQTDLDNATRKTKWAIAATIVTAACGVITTLITYFTSSGARQASE